MLYSAHVCERHTTPDEYARRQAIHRTLTHTTHLDGFVRAQRLATDHVPRVSLSMHTGIVQTNQQAELA